MSFKHLHMFVDGKQKQQVVWRRFHLCPKIVSSLIKKKNIICSTNFAEQTLFHSEVIYFTPYYLFITTCKLHALTVLFMQLFITKDINQGVLSQREIFKLHHFKFSSLTRLHSVNYMSTSSISMGCMLWIFIILCHLPNKNSATWHSWLITLHFIFSHGFN